MVRLVEHLSVAAASLSYAAGLVPEGTRALGHACTKNICKWQKSSLAQTPNRVLQIQKFCTSMPHVPLAGCWVIISTNTIQINQLLPTKDPYSTDTAATATLPPISTKKFTMWDPSIIT